MSALETILDRERAWLGFQPEFRATWAEGVSWVDRFLNDCEQRYVYSDYGPPLDAAVRTKLCAALVYHWRGARDAMERAAEQAGGVAPDAIVVSGAWVVQTVRGGARPTTPEEVEVSPRLMGGNPFRDLVLAAAVASGSAAAVEQFQADYRGEFERLARRFDLATTASVEWEELVLRLLTPRGGAACPAGASPWPSTPGTPRSATGSNR